MTLFFLGFAAGALLVIGGMYLLHVGAECARHEAKDSQAAPSKPSVPPLPEDLRPGDVWTLRGGAWVLTRRYLSGRGRIPAETTLREL